MEKEKRMKETIIIPMVVAVAVTRAIMAEEDVEDAEDAEEVWEAMMEEAATIERFLKTHGRQAQINCEQF
jgi:HD-like signal output (HDOD) protein